MPKMNLSTTERLMVAAIFTLGKSSVDDCYSVINPESDADDFNKHRMALRWFRGEMVQSYFRELQSIHADPITACDDGETDEPLTKGMLIKEMRKSLKQVKDPESRGKLIMKLADLANLKKEEEEKNAPPRNYFLPWVSDCRHCHLMVRFRDYLKTEMGGNND